MHFVAPKNSGLSVAGRRFCKHGWRRAGRAEVGVIAVTLAVWLLSWEKLSEPEKILMIWNTYRLMSIEQ